MRISTRSDSRRTATPSRWRTGVGDWHPAARKAEKSCSTDQRLRGRVHCLGVQWPAQPAGVTAVDGGSHAPVHDPIDVAARKRTEAGVEIVRHLPGPQHAQVRGAFRRAAEHPGLLRARGGRVEVGHLHQRMHAGVGAAGRGQPQLDGPRPSKVPARVRPARSARTAATASPSRPNRRTRSRWRLAPSAGQDGRLAINRSASCSVPHCLP